MHPHSKLQHLLDHLYAVRHPLDRLALRKRYSMAPVVALPIRTQNIVRVLRAAA